MMNELTNVMALTIAIEAVADEAVKEKLAKIKASYEKKSSSISKADAEKKAQNEALRTVVLDFMGDGVARTISQMIKECEALNGLSTSKVSAICKPLVDNGRMSKEMVKGHQMYSLVVEA